MTLRAPPRLCLVEDDAIMGESLCDRFRLEGYGVDWCRSAAEAEAALARERYGVVISDVRLPDRGGDELFAELRRREVAPPPFVFITAYGSVDRAVRLLKLGAADYVTKPFDLDELVGRVQALLPGAGGVAAAQDGLGVSAPMRRLAETLPKLARQANTVLISGESGVGKEHVALGLHRLARISEQCPFIPVNCGALPEGLIESELFGHEKGAFTGAVRARRGYVEQAHCGTLFLDEVGEMSLAMQVRLLRVIQERSITRVGGEARIPVRFRLLCATHRDLRQMVQEGTFREDLYYRINVIHLRVPPLRERPEDILWFARRFLEDFARQSGAAPHTLSPAAERALLAQPWPGNLRELKHCVERACILSADLPVLEPEAFFEDSAAAPGAEEAAERTLSAHLLAAERDFILRALERNRRQVGLTALELGISRKNLWEKMKRLGIEGG
jgi:DNA-binding NtrC family response regulator